MRLLTDECCDERVVVALETDGHDIVRVANMLAGISDFAVLQRAFEDERVLLRAHLSPRVSIKGRDSTPLRKRGSKHVIERTRTLLREKETDLLGNYVVVDGQKTRIRSVEP